MTRKDESGASLVEMLVAVFLMSFVAAGMCALATMNNNGGFKIFNKLDSLNAAREVIDTIGEDVRMARSVGDLYGWVIPPTQQLIASGAIQGPSTNVNVVNSNAVNVSALQNGTATLSSSQFPATGDPLYSVNQTPSGGWPAFPGDGTATGGAGPPYTLGQSTLIIQVPLFDQPGSGGTSSYPGGFPTKINVNPPPTVSLEAVDTYIFQVLPDPSTPGTYMMQVAGFAGSGQGPNGSVAASSMSINGQPRTILKGIVGPLDDNGNICVFQYIDKTTPSVPKTSVANSSVANISGVIVTLQILSQNASSTEPVSIGFKSEMYMRNNALATVVGL